MRGRKVREAEGELILPLDYNWLPPAQPKPLGDTWAEPAVLICTGLLCKHFPELMILGWGAGTPSVESQAEFRVNSLPLKWREAASQAHSATEFAKPQWQMWWWSERVQLYTSGSMLKWRIVCSFSADSFWQKPFLLFPDPPVNIMSSEMKPAAKPFLVLVLLKQTKNKWWGLFICFNLFLIIAVFSIQSIPSVALVGSLRWSAGAKIQGTCISLCVMKQWWFPAGQ